MTYKQKNLYFRRWGQVRQRLMQREGWTPKQADAFRHVLHVRALGYERSSKEFTNREFDEVLKLFSAYAQPEDREEQLRLSRQQTTRNRWVLQQLIDELGMTDHALDTMARRICKVTYNELVEGDYPKMIAALRYHRQRQRKKAREEELACAGEVPF